MRVEKEIDEFEMKARLMQGCLMSPLMFHMLLQMLLKDGNDKTTGKEG